MTKKLYTPPKLTLLGQIPRKFIEGVLIEYQSHNVILDYWIIYQEVQKLIPNNTVRDSFIIVGERMDKSDRTVEQYYYKAKKIIDKLNVEI